MRAAIRVAANRAGTLLRRAIHTRVRGARGYLDRTPAAALRTRPDKTAGYPMRPATRRAAWVLR